MSYRKVSHKARRGRKRRPKPHGQHRKGGGTQDPFIRAARRDYDLRRARLDEESAA